jgi:hypothetical protein
MPYKNPYDQQLPDSKTKNFPDWKGQKRRNAQLYKSERVLGKMWHIMNDKIQSIKRPSTIQSEHTPKKREDSLPVNVLKILNECDDENMLQKLRKEMEVEINSYIEIRSEKSKTLSQEEFFQWKDEFCSSSRERILKGKSWKVAGDQEVTAVLYEQCRKLDSLDRYNQFDTHGRCSHATEFAWNVAADELIKLLAVDLALCVGKVEEKILYGS